MSFLKSIDLTTRLIRDGKLTQALAVLGGAMPKAGSQILPGAKPLFDGATLRATLEAGLGALLQPGAAPTAEAAPSPSAEGASFTEQTYAGPSGSLSYKLYRPASAGPAPLPLVVMLHGCTQSPDDFATGTRMNALAEREGVFVAYPAQSRAANAQKCWNWFRAVDQGRSGEPALVVGMVQAILATHAVDPARVYVAGLSAGGAAAAVLGQTYPEVFAAVGVHSGLACRAAADMGSAFAAMRGGAPVQPTGTGIPTIVLHGDRDMTVAPINGAQVLTQAEPSEALTEAVSTATAPGGQRYTRTVLADASGRPQAEHWVLHGAGHAWSGGDPAGTYTDPRGPDASAAMLRFFERHAGPRP
ncbi:PHB depolymerase family esterase [Lichenihabitans sp. Uapishka_5]|uniref:extracellular catalytic domain type 1 short-chain-length polyhydroxyalkanoate depolymerase n=1 Tax=Lichenihabitans sp. Uapishka_5 TaxID=3037302 RepID=UPI0029E7F594|nr:PHB depolymerase family esterase [Lichenihabitans sp. Uapishka_5]MDX7952931.1 PHB depolymerase family esterase [Lichenihabitans sp. Uapishka_5]